MLFRSTLEEYRALAALAFANDRRAADAPVISQLPRATLSSCAYVGSVTDSAAIIDAAFSIAVADDDWAVLPLGMTEQTVGSLELDGKPAYAITDGGCLFLPVKGAGTHTGAMRLLLPVTRDSDVSAVAGFFPPAAARYATLTIPGRVEPVADDAARAVYDRELNRTTLIIAPGGDAGLSVKWRPIHGARETDALTEADQTLTVDLSRGSARIDWSATVSVHRRQTDQLAFDVPGNIEFFAIQGPLVLEIGRASCRERV